MILIPLVFLKLTFQIILYQISGNENNSKEMIMRYVAFLFDIIWLFWQIYGNVKYFSNEFELPKSIF